MDIKITLEIAKEKILQALIDAEIGTYMTMYASDKTGCADYHAHTKWELMRYIDEEIDEKDT